MSINLDIYKLLDDMFETKQLLLLSITLDKNKKGKFKVEELHKLSRNKLLDNCKYQLINIFNNDNFKIIKYLEDCMRYL